MGSEMCIRDRVNVVALKSSIERAERLSHLTEDELFENLARQRDANTTKTTTRSESLNSGHNSSRSECRLITASEQEDDAVESVLGTAVETLDEIGGESAGNNPEETQNETVDQSADEIPDESQDLARNDAADQSTEKPTGETDASVTGEAAR